jgi:uncharacterized membrane protein
MARRISLWVMAILYIAAGINHFVHPQFYLQIVPPYLPAHEAVVYLSGVAESGLGVALLVPRLSRLAAWGVVALLIAIYPANLYMWTGHVAVDGKQLPALFHVVRLVVQLVLIAWAWSHTRPRRDA